MTDGASTPGPQDRNAAWIAEFRANAGRLGGNFEGVPVLLLHDVDAATGEERITPLTCQPLDRGWAVFASSGGAPVDPAWYRNLLAHPAVTVEFGASTYEATARLTEGAERDAIWSRQKELMPAFARYEQEAGRTIPVLVLDPH